MPDNIVQKRSKASPGTILKRAHKRLNPTLSLKAFARTVRAHQTEGQVSDHTARCALAWLDAK